MKQASEGIYQNEQGILFHSSVTENSESKIMGKMNSHRIFYGE